MQTKQQQNYCKIRDLEATIIAELEEGALSLKTEVRSEKYKTEHFKRLINEHNEEIGWLNETFKKLEGESSTVSTQNKKMKKSGK